MSENPEPSFRKVETLEDLVAEDMTPAQFFQIFLEMQQEQLRQAINTNEILGKISKDMNYITESFQQASSTSPHNKSPPPRSSSRQPLRQRSEQSKTTRSQHTQRSDTPQYSHEFRPCDKDRYPNSDADEYCYWNTAPENIKRAAEDRATVDGWKHWRSKTGKYIYRQYVGTR